MVHIAAKAASNYQRTELMSKSLICEHCFRLTQILYCIRTEDRTSRHLRRSVAWSWAYIQSRILGRRSINSRHNQSLGRSIRLYLSLLHWKITIPSVEHVTNVIQKLSIIRRRLRREGPNNCANEVYWDQQSSPETRFGPNVRAGFMLSVYCQKQMQERQLLTYDNSDWNPLFCSSNDQRIEAISKNVMRIVPIKLTRVFRTVGPAPFRTKPQTKPNQLTKNMGIVSFVERLPLNQNAIETAGLMCAPLHRPMQMMTRATMAPNAGNFER